MGKSNCNLPIFAPFYPVLPNKLHQNCTKKHHLFVFCKNGVLKTEQWLISSSSFKLQMLN